MNIFKLTWFLQGINNTNVTGESFFKTSNLAEKHINEMVETEPFFRGFSDAFIDGKASGSMLENELSNPLRVDTFERIFKHKAWLHKSHTVELDKILKVEFRLSKIIVHN